MFCFGFFFIFIFLQIKIGVEIHDRASTSHPPTRWSFLPGADMRNSGRVHFPQCWPSETLHPCIHWCIPNILLHTQYPNAYPLCQGTLRPIGLPVAKRDGWLHPYMHQRNHSCPVEPKPPPHTSFNWQATPHMSCSDNLWTGSTFFLFENTLAIFARFLGTILFSFFQVVLKNSPWPDPTDHASPNTYIWSSFLAFGQSFDKIRFLPHGFNARNRLTNMKKKNRFLISFKH